MTSEELRARLLRNAQRTDAAKAGAKWQKLMQTEAVGDTARQAPGSTASQSQRREPGLLEAAAAAVGVNDDEGGGNNSDTTRRLLRHYGRYSSRAARRAVEAASAPNAGQAEHTVTAVTFWLQYHAEWGQRLRVIGSHPSIGSWDVTKASELKWNEGDRWSTTVELTPGRIVEYKYVVLASDGDTTSAWQLGNNSVLAIQAGEKTVEVFDNWTGQPGAAVVADGLQGTRESRLTNWAETMASQADSNRHELRRSRMELVASQEEARVARETVRATRMELAVSEAERARLVVANRTSEATQRALRSQLAEAGTAFRAAMTTAQNFLDQAELGEMPRDPEAEIIAAQAVDMILPQRSASGMLMRTESNVRSDPASSNGNTSGAPARQPESSPESSPAGNSSLGVERHGQSMLTTSRSTSSDTISNGATEAAPSPAQTDQSRTQEAARSLNTVVATP